MRRTQLGFRKRSGVSALEARAVITTHADARTPLFVEIDGAGYRVQAVDVVTLADGSTAILVSTRAAAPEARAHYPPEGRP